MEAATYIFVLIIIIALAVAPGEIATRRGHKNAAAIKACGYIGLIFPPAWFVGIIWSFTKP